MAPVVNAGYASVSFFILLSGFVLAYNYAARARTGELDKVRFWKARFTRLYPIYLLSLLLSLADGAGRSTPRTPTPCSGRGWC
jgi:peptidoglycan/LPS O-acetylase OafA/YrhL